jgi:hypothetical protein
MRGGDRNTGALFSYVSYEARVAKSHPLRAIRQIVDAARHRGLARVGWIFTFTAAAYNLVRLPQLLGTAA